MINRQRLVDTFLDLVRIDNPSGHEQEVARYCSARLAALGFSLESDSAGNLFAKRQDAKRQDAKRPGRGQPLMVNAHMDSVQPCMGIKPVVDGDTIHSDGTTILGADDRASVAAILEALQVLVEEKLAAPPLEVVLTVCEEMGLKGVREMDFSHITAKEGVTLDHEGPAGGIVIAAPYQDRLLVTIHGKMAHAGVAPEQGISAIRVAAEAIAAMPLGRIDPETTSNIGIIHGGSARNVVPGRVDVEGEARSRNEAKLKKQTGAMVHAFEEAAARHGARAELTVTRNYHGFRVRGGKRSVAAADSCRPRRRPRAAPGRERRRQRCQRLPPPRH